MTQRAVSRFVNASCHLLTPSGTGAIALIRVVGRDAAVIVSNSFRPRRGPSEFGPENAGRVRFGEFVEGDEVIDDVTVCSDLFATVPFIDITAHGGPRIVQRILRALESAGASMHTCQGSPWAAGNLIEAESLTEMISAKTTRVAAFLAYQRTNLPLNLAAIAELCTSRPESAAHALSELARAYPAARVLLRGLRIALIGPPNSGKSTLFNRLVGRPAAVVSPFAGTTRDWVSADLEFDGIPITLLDTPGRHDTGDALEHAALQAAERITRDIDAAILVFDSSGPLPTNAGDLIRAARNATRSVVALNKSDLPDSRPRPLCKGLTQHESNNPPFCISAQSGDGCRDLLDHLVRELATNQEMPAIFTERQLQLSCKALEYLACKEIALAAETIHQQLICPLQDDCGKQCL